MTIAEQVEEFMSQYAWGKFFTVDTEVQIKNDLVKILQERDRIARAEENTRCLQALQKPRV